MIRQRLSRRDFLQWSSVAAGGMILAGCTPAAAPTDGAAASDSAAVTSDEQITLNVLAENWGELYNGLMTIIGDEYTKEHPNVTVDWNFDPDWQTKLTTLIAAGTPPDCNHIRPGALAVMGRKGVLLDLTDLVTGAGHTRDDFVASIYDSSTYDGKLYALPGGADYICLFYSKDAMRDAGLDPEQPPTTAAELIEQSMQLLQKNASGDIERIGYAPGAGNLVDWTFIHDGRFYDEGSGKITANEEVNVDVLEWMGAYMKELDIDKLAAFNQRPGTYEAGNAFSTKQAAFFFNGFWTFEALDEFSPDIDYGVAFWPTVNGTEEERANYAISGWMYSIPQESAHRDEAWDFINYAFIDQAALMGYKTLNGPCVKAALPDWEAGLRDYMGADNRMVPYLEVFSQTGAAATNFFPVLPIGSYYNDELTRIYDLVMREEVTAQAGLDEVTANVQAELDKAMAG
ncbi:MAG TPA: substrate-binding domain-containing protein [Caldilineaceae bacterium]|nr:substrate-binding domain-containing protein [Caldilineaceae bacterium]